MALYSPTQYARDGANEGAGVGGAVGPSVGKRVGERVGSGVREDVGPERGSIFGKFYFWTPSGRRDRRAASERSRSGAPLGTFRSARVLGVHRRQAPRCC